MKRTSIEIDEGLLSEVQLVLGTTGIKDTVERAFQEILRAHLRRRLAKRLEGGLGIDRGPALLKETRRWER